MARRKQFITPNSGRIATTLNKRQLKEFKKMSIEFERPQSEILALAVELMIEKYQKLTPAEIDEKGLKAMFEK